MKRTQQRGVGALGAVHIRSTDRNDRLFPSFVTHGIVISIGVFDGSVSIFGFIFFWFFQIIDPRAERTDELDSARFERRRRRRTRDEASGRRGEGDGITMDVADDELGLPKSTVVKMVQDALAPLGGLRMSPECRDLVVDCCAEFVNAVASEANEISTKEKKTTINPDHVLAALRALGFEAYEAECAIARDEAKEEETEKRQMKKAKKNIGMSAEEAIAMQQQLFAQAKAKMAGQDVGGGDDGDAGGGEPAATLGSLG